MNVCCEHKNLFTGTFHKSLFLPMPTSLQYMHCVCSNVCGGRVRVEFSTGKSKQKPWQRRAAPPSLSTRRAFDPEDRCYECGQRGHYAYDCRDRRRR